MKILMVCLGNICRSPLAEGILKAKLPANFTVESCGTINLHEGKNPDQRSVEIASQYNLDISEQRSRPFNRNDFEIFDRIYCMDRTNWEDVISLADKEQEREKVRLILSDEQDVPDPYWGDLKDFDHVYQLLDKACEDIAKELQAETD